jgi:hypothetical protein
LVHVPELENVFETTLEAVFCVVPSGKTKPEELMVATVVPPATMLTPLVPEYWNRVFCVDSKWMFATCRVLML